jgi:uncharacterized membrane protein
MQQDPAPASDLTPASNPWDPASLPVFEAILYPHRSLGKRGYLILILGTAIIMGVYALTFLILGAWPIFGFIGAEWLLFWYLFSRHLRGDRRTERLRLYPDRLILERVDAKGRFSALSLQPYWLRVILERGDEADGNLYLGSHGKAIEIGAFLSGPERKSFAEELTRILGRLRDGDYLPQT